MAIPIDASAGQAVRWIGEPHQEMTGPETTDWVHPGDEGTFITFDGPPGEPEVVVTFPAVGAFVCSSDDVDLVS
jgi:hypothetical protein